MTTVPRRRFLTLTGTSLGLGLGLGLAGAVAPARAARRDYRLDPAASTVGFFFSINGVPQKGTMPVTAAKISVDPDNLAASRVDVTLSVAKARTGLMLATDALKSPEILDAARYPTVRFVSTSVRLGADGRISGGASLAGRLTIRDVTRPVTFSADLYRPKGSAPDDLSRLTVRLSGAISRSAFGASGYAGLVDDTVTLDITAAIRAA